MDNGFSIYIDPNTPQEMEVQVFETTKGHYIHFDNETLRFFIKGIILNKNELIQKFQAKDLPGLIQKIYNQNKSNFSEEFTGEYSGFLFDKSTRKLFVFTNLIASQAVFYYNEKGKILIDTDLFRLKKELTKRELTCNLNIQAAYSILTLVSLLDNQTLIKEIRKLRSEEQIIINLNGHTLQTSLSGNLNNPETYNQNKKNALADLDELFRTAVRQEFNYDDEIGKEHFALLSGGLDSRLNILYAHESGYEINHVLCFSHSNYWDEKIARKITEDLKIPIQVVHLDGGDFLKEIDSMTETLKTLMSYTAGSHSKFALNKVDFTDFGLIHSGHLGDAVLGSYLSQPKKIKPENGIKKLIKNRRFLPKVEDYIYDLAREFPNEEMFLLKNRGFNYIAAGAYVAENFSFQVSPFMHKDFLKLSLSLPDEWRFNQKIYIEWIKKYNKNATRYIWERTLMKPDAAWKTGFGDKFTVRFYNNFYKRILNRPEKISMAPYSYYFKMNLSLRQYFENYFREHIEFLDKEPELKKDLETMFQEGDFTEKSSVLSFLSAYKKLFI